MQKIVLSIMLCLSFFGSVFAVDVDPIAQTKQLLDQYALRVSVLEKENAILREEISKAGIKIPLSAFSGIVQTAQPIVSSTGTVATGVTTKPPVTSSGEFSTEMIAQTYGASPAGFIKRIVGEWDKVRDAYSLPKSARIGGYEFVASGALDHVFVDIIYTGSISASGMYDAKILYQFDKTTFARKLIGLFEYNPTTGYYVTKTGKNIFPGVKRTWVPDPRELNKVVTPPTTTPSTGTTVVTPPVTNPTTPVNTVTFAEIEAAYTAKRFLSVITLSNTWLATNAPTVEILRLRYRTYFIIAKYPEALKEIEKIKAMGQLTSSIACE